MPLRDRLARWLMRDAPEQRSGDASSSGGMTTLPPFGNQWPIYGSRYLPENFATVSACVQAIAGAIASLPATVYRIDGKRRIEAPDHPVSRIIARPNELQSWSDWVEWLVASTLLQGNAVAIVDHDGAGRPTALYPVPWWSCQPILVPANGADAIGSPIVPNSRLVFDVTQTMMPWPLPAARPANGYPVRFFADQVVFLRDRSDDGILGRSRLSRSPDALACALGGQSFSTGLWSNGALIGGVISHPGILSAEASQRVAQSWRDIHSGASNASKIAILEEGMKFDHVGISPEDAELLESRRFSVEEVCRLFGVPPPLIADWTHATFSNSASATEWFGSLTLLPWVQKIEREFSRSVFNSADFVLSIDLSGMLRGDYATMMASNIAAVRAGVMSADEARLEAGLDPRGGAADKLQPQAVGGRPGGTGDGQGDALPELGARPNGSGKANGTGRPNGTGASA